MNTQGSERNHQHPGEGEPLHRVPHALHPGRPGAPSGSEHVDIAVVGAGAAGLMAAIWAGRTVRAATGAGADGPRGLSEPRPRIVALDGARSLGAKILVAGGGRCNVTHDVVDPREYSGSSVNAIRKVLLRFDVPQTVAFFRELGVELKREETGKLFPVSDDARTVLQALLRAAREAEVDLRHPWRVARVGSEEGDAPGEGGFRIVAADDAGAATIVARRVILATGGRALPRSGSDGHGHAMVQALGHTITEAVFPALVPLVVDPSSDRFGIRDLSGITAIAVLEVRAGSGKRLKAIRGSTLCTHFGLSGPGPMDISRHLTEARRHDPKAYLLVNWLPEITVDELDRQLLALGVRSVGRFLRAHPAAGPGGLPERLVNTFCRVAGVEPDTAGAALRRQERRALAGAVTEHIVPVAGDRGWNAAETTAGGVPLSELDLKTMESRKTPGLHLCGEICDVDGRIGGYNFQWAWASGYVAGIAAAAAVLRPGASATGGLGAGADVAGAGD